MPGVKIHIIFRIPVFSKTDAATPAAPYGTVFDDPSFRPVGADKAVLICGRGRPGGRTLVDIEAGHCYIIYAVFIRHEAVPPDQNFYLLGIGIQVMEIGIKYCLIAVLLRIPFPYGFLSVPGTRIGRTADTFLQSHCLIHHPVVQKHAAGMAYSRRKVPVAADHSRIGIIGAENAVVHPVYPGIP